MEGEESPVSAVKVVKTEGGGELAIVDAHGQDLQQYPHTGEEVADDAADETEVTALSGNISESDLNGQQVIIVAEDGSLTVESATEGADGLEPAAKRFRVEQDDGQTYVLAVAGVDAGATLHEALSADEHSVEQLQQQDTDITQAWFTSRDDKTALQSKGHQWKQGQWSKEEIDLLQSNINSYCKDHQIGDPTEVVFEMSKDERKDFYRTIARGLQRPLFSVYRRVIRMYDQKNHIGKYTPEEIQALRELRKRHGTDWATIGAALGRSASSVKDRCRLMRDTCNSGKWHPEEERRLSTAVYELSGASPGESITTGLSWASVADKVGTRSEKQCRTKWLNYLNWKQKGGSDWTREDDIALVLKIAASDAQDENQIDWAELAKGWTSARSPQWLRGKWWSMKRHVPDYLMLTFREIVEYIRNIHTQNKEPINNRLIAQSLRLKSPGLPGHPSNLKLGQLNLQKVSVVQNMTLHVPVSMASSADVGVGNPESDEGDSSGYQTLEVLQSLAQSGSTPQGAFLITQPQNNPAISFTTANMATDHIIVHTLPINQVQGSIQGNENVTVQMNPESHVIISTNADQDTVASVDGSEMSGTLTSVDGTEMAGTLQLEEGIDQSEQDLPVQVLSQPDEMSVETSEISQSNLENQDQIDGHTEIITSEDNVTFEATTIATIDATDMADEVGQEDLDTSTAVSSDLVLEVTSGPGSPHFVQSGGNNADLIHMSSLSDPMLPSDGTDLIGSSSDVEAEKGHGNDGDSPDS